VSLPPEPPPLASIESADALYDRVLHRGRRLRRERRAFLGTAALSFMLLAIAVPIALTNGDGSQVATTGRPPVTRRPAPTTTQTTEHVYPPYVDPTTTQPATAVVQGATVTTAARVSAGARSTATTRRASPTTTRPPTRATTTAPQTTTTTVVPGSAPASACTPSDALAAVDRQIAFVRGGDIWIAPAAGGGSANNLTNSSAVEQGPAWSPDGTRIAFVRDGGLFVMTAVQGAVPSRLTDADSSPAWSYDGRVIAFVRADDIRTIGANGGADELAIDVAEPLASPTWSPDGCQLAFSWQGNVLRARSDGTGITMARSRAMQPSWGRTGRIAFASVIGNRTEVGIVDPSGAGFQQLTFGGGSQPAWSPAGDAVAYQTPPTGEVGIHTRRTDGSGSTRVTDQTGDTDPAW
jgi:dipeptidyl aminopeptidase/acylaminoacyl peptidase